MTAVSQSLADCPDIADFVLCTDYCLNYPQSSCDQLPPNTKCAEGVTMKNSLYLLRNQAWLHTGFTLASQPDSLSSQPACTAKLCSSNRGTVFAWNPQRLLFVDRPVSPPLFLSAPRSCSAMSPEKMVAFGARKTTVCTQRLAFPQVPRRRAT